MGSCNDDEIHGGDLLTVRQREGQRGRSKEG